jgi:hypothetical protein
LTGHGNAAAGAGWAAGSCVSVHCNEPGRKPGTEISRAPFASGDANSALLIDLQGVPRSSPVDLQFASGDANSALLIDLQGVPQSTPVDLQFASGDANSAILIDLQGVPQSTPVDLQFASGDANSAILIDLQGVPRSSPVDLQGVPPSSAVTPHDRHRLISRASRPARR